MRIKLDENLGQRVTFKDAGRIYMCAGVVYTGFMEKDHNDIDEEGFREARTAPGMNTRRQIVGEALLRASPRREALVAKALDTLAKATISDRADAWR